jgi:hypothetical protein
MPQIPPEPLRTLLKNIVKAGHEVSYKRTGAAFINLAVRETEVSARSSVSDCLNETLRQGSSCFGTR